LRQLKYILFFLILGFIFSCTKSESSKSDKFKIDPLPVIQNAMKNKKYLIIIFESADCRYCSKLNKEVLSDFKVKERLIKDKFDVAIVNVYGKRKVIDPETKEEMNEQILAYVYKVQGFPTIAVFDPTQNYKLLFKITGYLPKENFINMIDYIGSGCYKKVPFEKYLENNKTC